MCSAFLSSTFQSTAQSIAVIRGQMPPSTYVSEILCEMLEGSPSDEQLVVSTLMKPLHPTFLSDKSVHTLREESIVRTQY